MNLRRLRLETRLVDRPKPPREEDAVHREVLRLALPATGEQLLGMMIGIVDTFLVGHLGAASLAAVGLANQWVFLAYTLLSAIGTGSTALIARFTGAREPDLANSVLRQSVLVALLVGLSCTALGTLLARPAVLLLGAQAEVVDLSTTYLTTVAATLGFATLLYLGNACLRGAGDTRTPLYVMVVVNVINIVVAWTLINGSFGLPRLGVWGSALGAASGQVAGGSIVLWLLLRGRSGIKLSRSGLGPDWTMIRRILRVGMPTGVEQLLFRIGNMAYVRILASLGIAAYAANQVAINGWSLSFMPGFGFAVAATTLVGQALGAREPHAAERKGYVAFGMGAALMAVIGVGMILFPEQIMGFFTDDQEVIRLGATPLQVMGLVQPMLAASMIFAGALRGAGDTRWPMIVTGGCIWLVRLPLAYLFAIVFGWGLLGAWIAMSMDLILRGSFNYWRFRLGGWKSIQV
jgi:multidrug resistance protein, MATE family